jgi:hypothetical protein
MTELTDEQRAKQQAALDRIRQTKKPERHRHNKEPSRGMLAIGAAVVVALVLLIVNADKSQPPAVKSDAELRAEAEVARQKQVAQQQEEFNRAQADAEAKSAYDRAVASLNDIHARFTDTKRIAGATSRIALSGPVASLQALSREAKALDLPPCLADARESLALAIDQSVEGSLMFMTNEKGQEPVMVAMFVSSDNTTKMYERKMAACLPVKSG